jgi:hypothetical protein
MGIETGTRKHLMNPHSNSQIFFHSPQNQTTQIRYICAKKKFWKWQTHHGVNLNFWVCSDNATDNTNHNMSFQLGQDKPEWENKKSK